MSQDPLGDITTFIRAAEAGNFTRAARVLGLTPSAVSKAIARLEAELNVRLFRRSPRQITLTGDGELFFETCRASLTAVEDARSNLAGHAQPLRGRLRIAVPVSFGQYVVAPALSGWLERFPGLDVDLILTDRQVDMTAERFDLAVLLGEVPDSRLVARPLPTHCFCTVASPAYLKRHGEPHEPAALVGHACLRYTMAHSGQPRIWTFTKGHKTYRHFPEGPLSSDHAAVLLALAEGGRGIVQAPRYVVASAVRARRLRVILGDYPTDGAALTVVYAGTRQISARIRCAADFLLSLGSQL